MTFSWAIGGGGGGCGVDGDDGNVVCERLQEVFA